MSDRPLFRNRYRIRGKLGSGAFATVYLAHDTRMDRPVAIKVVDDAGEPDGRAFREAQAAAKLNHPHIVTAVSYTHLRAHETDSYLVCRLLLEKKKKQK